MVQWSGSWTVDMWCFRNVTCCSGQAGTPGGENIMLAKDNMAWNVQLSPLPVNFQLEDRHKARSLRHRPDRSSYIKDGSSGSYNKRRDHSNTVQAADHCFYVPSAAHRCLHTLPGALEQISATSGVDSWAYASSVYQILETLRRLQREGAFDGNRRAQEIWAACSHCP